MNGMLDSGQSDIEKWKGSFISGVTRWKGVQQDRAGLGEGFFVGNEMFVEMNYTLRMIHVAIKLPKTHQARAISNEMARSHSNGNAAKDGWVELNIDSQEALQNALTLARQGYMEFQR